MEKVFDHPIVDDCDFVVAFWDGESAGTLDTIRKACRVNKEVLIYIHPWSQKSVDRVQAIQKSGKNWFERVQAKLGKK